MARSVLSCSDCKRWGNIGGTPVCSLCRINTIQLLPTDPRITAANYDLVASILERAIGEATSWLSIPLDQAPDLHHPTSPGREVEQTAEIQPAIQRVENISSGESSPKKHRDQKEKRSSRDTDRREDRKEERRQLPRREYPSAICKRKATPQTELETIAECREFNFTDGHQVSWGRCHKKNKGKKHCERGGAYRAQRESWWSTHPGASAHTSRLED